MDKNLQREYNTQCLIGKDRLETYLDSPKDYEISSAKRLRYCTAETHDICDKNTGEYLGTFLVSYRTITAFYDAQENATYDWLRYVYGFTSTSAQHFAKFHHDYGYNSSIYRYYHI